MHTLKAWHGLIRELAELAARTNTSIVHEAIGFSHSPGVQPSSAELATRTNKSIAVCTPEEC